MSKPQGKPCINVPNGYFEHMPKYAPSYAPGTRFFIQDLRSFERNKYSPWGRGQYGGKQVNA